MKKDWKILLINKYFYIFIDICFIICFFSIIYINDAFSMLEEDNFSYDYIPPSVTVKKNRSSSEELTSFDVIIDNDEQQDNYLYLFIQKYLVQHESISESELKKTLRTSGQYAGVVLGSLAGIPYFQVAREAGGQNKILSWGMGVTNTLATSGTGAWAYFDLLKSFDPQSDEEKLLLQKSKLPLPGHLTAHALGFVVAVPTAYMTAKFNTYKWLAGISYLLDYSLKTSGYLNLFKNAIAKKDKINCFLVKRRESEDFETDSSVQNMQQLLIHHLIHKTIPNLLAMSSEERNQLITSMNQRNDLTVENYLEFLLNLSSSAASLPKETPDTWKKGYPKIAFISALSLSAVLNIVHNSLCAYEAWQMLYGSPGFTIPMAALSTIPTFILEMRATIEVGGSVYDSAFYHISKEPQPSLLRVLYPKLSRILPVVCISLAGVTAYVGRFMVESILRDILPQQEARSFFVIGGFMGPFLFAAYANHSIITDLLLKYTQSFGETSKKKLTLLIQDVEKLIKVIRLIKPEDMKKFLENENIQMVLSFLNRERDEEPRGEIPHPQNADIENESPPKCGIM